VVLKITLAFQKKDSIMDEL